MKPFGLYIIFLPAFNGLGTPPTKTVFLGSNGKDASRTKSASLNLQGLIWTGLSLIVGLETHKYSLSSSWIQASIRACTDDSSCNRKKKLNFLPKSQCGNLRNFSAFFPNFSRNDYRQFICIIVDSNRVQVTLFLTLPSSNENARNKKNATTAF